MRKKIDWRAGAFALLLLLAFNPSVRAEDFEPDLGQAREVIAGKEVLRTSTISADAKELTVYPLSAEHPRQTMTALPNQSFRQVTPMPLARAWWKYPFYAVLGLPRDLVDAVAGGLNYIPVLSIPLVMGAYELVPLQFFMRDWRDWHRWPGMEMNALRHGPHDGDSWGWFPSLNNWNFTYPSQDLARRNELYNQQLKARLDQENRQIEQRNAELDARLRDTRARALKAIQSGDGAEAANRMIPYRHSYPLDEGGFALFATAMALYSATGPDWVAPVLWSELEFAQPRLLAEAEKLLATTARQHPDRTAVTEALIYTRLLLGRAQAAAEAAQNLLKAKPSDPYRLRLVYETAMAARENKLARQTRAAMSPTSYDEPTRQLMDLRLQLADGDAAGALEPLRQLAAQHPEDPYAAYYLACAMLMLAPKMDNPAATYKAAASLLNDKARDLAPGPAMRLRADRAASWVQSILTGISAEPQLFTEQTPTTATATTTK